MKQQHAANLIIHPPAELIQKWRYVKKRARYKVLLIVSVLMTLTSTAQEYPDEQNTDATVIKINDNSGNEEKPVKCYITYSEYTKKLEVKRVMPLTPLQTEISDTSADSNLLTFDLLFDLDQDKMQEKAASGKIFSDYGVFTLNNCSRNVLIEYSSLPAPVHRPGEFNISLMVSINPSDFKMEDKNSEWILKINDAVINQVDD